MKTPDWFIVRFKDVNEFEILEAGFNNDFHPKSPIMMNKISHYAARHGSNNILVLRNERMKIEFSCYPLSEEK